MILPPIDESLIDKIILLKAHKREMPMPTETAEQKAAFWDKLVAELPAFLSYLDHWEIPSQLISSRFGITHFHHPALLEAIESLAHEVKLLALIDAVYWPQENEQARIKSAQPKEILLTAEELEARLIDSSQGYQAKSLLSWNNAAGTFLGRLAQKYPHRIAADRTSDRRLWRIKRPGATAE